MDKLKQTRSAFRGHLTRALDRLEKALNEKDESEVKIYFETVKTKEQTVENINEKIMEYLSEEEEINEEIDECEAYRNRSIRLKVMAKDFIEKYKTKLGDVSVSSGSVGAVKLPKLSLKTFDGKYEDWQSWIECFKVSVHLNNHLSDVEKFTYLKSLVIGAAERSIAGLSLTEKNYSEAMKMLEKRFGRTELIISAHIKSLIAVPSVDNNTSTKSLRHLYDEFEVRTRSLRSLNVPMDSYSILLVPLFESKLPSDVLLTFNRTLDEDSTDLVNLEDLLKFVASEVTVRERIEFSKKEINQNQESKTKIEKPVQVRPAVSSLTTYGESRKMECIFCAKDHKSFKCENVDNISINERKAIISKKRACFNCLRIGHQSRNCTIKVFCKNCKKSHQSLLCEQAEKNDKTIVTCSKIQHSSNLQCISVGVVGAAGTKKIRILFDGGSQRSFIRSSLCSELSLRKMGQENLKVSAFGGIIQNKGTVKRFEVGLSTKNGTFNIEALAVNEICSPVKNDICEEWIKKLNMNNIHIENVNEELCDISLLIGADYYWELVTGNIFRITNGPTAVESVFGWMLHGGQKNGSENEVSSLHVSLEDPHSEKLCQQLENFWNLESIGIKEEGQLQNNDVMENFRKTVVFDEFGYTVKLPWIQDKRPSNNFGLAKKRLDSLLRRIKNDSFLFEEYNRTIQDYVLNDYAEEVTESEHDKIGYFLPHQAVIKRSRESTKVRIVFDGSARSYNKLSINDCLVTGPNLNSEIFNLLLKFRMHKYAITADIKQAFLRVHLDQKDREFVKYLWIDPSTIGDENPKLKYLKMKVVLFGLSCSPFLLAGTIQYHLEKNLDKYPYTALMLKEHFYVDDLILSVKTNEAAKSIILEGTEIMKRANMELTKWQTNSMELKDFNCGDSVVFKDSDNFCSKILGLCWNYQEDEFYFNVDELSSSMEEINNLDITKRKLISFTSRIFDPLGFLTPFLIRAKVLIQDLWRLKIGWDTVLPDEIVKTWRSWFKEVLKLQSIRIPRWYLTVEDQLNMELHTFCDASKKSYATCIYLRAIREENVTCNLIASKTRVAPLKNLSVPRLELMAATIGARFQTHVRNLLDITIENCFMWTDSKIVYHWIQGSSKKWKPFVSNRVEEIMRHTLLSNWRHCPGAENPADLATRGISVSCLNKSDLWWNGPSGVCSFEHVTFEEKHSSEVHFTEQEKENLNDEIRRDHVLTIETKKKDVLFNLERFSSLLKTVRVTAWISRFIHNCRSSLKKQELELSSEEVKTAKEYWILVCQEENFSEEITKLKKSQKIEKSSSIHNLYPFLDGSGVLRVGGRLHFSSLSEVSKHQIILPKDSRLVELLVQCSHERLLHAGERDVFVELRQIYWIIKARQKIKKILHGCQVCRRWTCKPYHEDVAPLPSFRCEKNSAFNAIGIDFAGPVFINSDNNEVKAYICLITCASTRAVHLELVSSLKSRVFLLAFKRFVSRRGLPSVVVTDNAKTFKHASKEWKDLLCMIKSPLFQHYLISQEIEWKFIVDRAPWWGGFWERMVKSVKIPLRKILRGTILDFEEFGTVLCEIEAVLNSRPLTYIYNDAEIEPLTPGHFIASRRLVTQYSIDDQSSLNESLMDKWKQLSLIREQFWKVWLKEYLPELNKYHETRSGFTRKIAIGDVVLVNDDDKPRQKWELGIVQELINGGDGRIRSAIVKLRKKLFRRPIQKLYFLEGQDFESKVNCNDDLVTGGV